MNTQTLEATYALGPGQSSILLANSGSGKQEYHLSPVQQGLLFHSLSAAEPVSHARQTGRRQLEDARRFAA